MCTPDDGQWVDDFPMGHFFFSLSLPGALITLRVHNAIASVRVANNFHCPHPQFSLNRLVFNCRKRPCDPTLLKGAFQDGALNAPEMERRRKAGSTFHRFIVPARWDDVNGFGKSNCARCGWRNAMLCTCLLCVRPV